MVLHNIRLIKSKSMHKVANSKLLIGVSVIAQAPVLRHAWPSSRTSQNIDLSIARYQGTRKQAKNGDFGHRVILNFGGVRGVFRITKKQFYMSVNDILLKKVVLRLISPISWQFVIKNKRTCSCVAKLRLTDDLQQLRKGYCLRHTRIQ